MIKHMPIHEILIIVIYNSIYFIYIGKLVQLFDAKQNIWWHWHPFMIEWILHPPALTYSDLQ